jgi:hypothetical protein
MVRLDDVCYAVIITNSGAVQLYRRGESAVFPDGYNGWSLVTPLTINGATTGVGGTRPTNSAAIAATRDGYLHVTWGRLEERGTPAFGQQWYRWVRIADWTLGSIETLHTSTTQTLGAIDIAATDAPSVYVTAPGPASMGSGSVSIYRMQPNTGGYAAPTLFVAAVGGPGSTAWKARLAVDSTGMLHCAYNNDFDWMHGVASASGFMSNNACAGSALTSPFNFGDIAADIGGNVYIGYADWLDATQYQVKYRRWSNGGYSASVPISVSSGTGVRDAPHNSVLVFATTENGGTGYIIRGTAGSRVTPLSTGPFVSILSGGGTYMPGTGASGALWPTSDRNHCEVRVTSTQSNGAWTQTTNLCGCSRFGNVFLYSTMHGDWTAGSTNQLNWWWPGGGIPTGEFALCFLSFDVAAQPVPITHGSLSTPFSCPNYLSGVFAILPPTTVYFGHTYSASVTLPNVPLNTTLWSQWFALPSGMSSTYSSAYLR